ncbi:calcium-binding protein [Lentibacter algarum]|nr:calcium-binding protein [Lentibacter algarum]
MNHLEGGAETTVPYWLGKLAEADGQGFSADGQWGFLRDFAREGKPLSNWSITGVRPSWNRDNVSFAATPFTAIVTNPANFVQYQSPDAPYDGANADNASPLSTLLKLYDTHVAPRPLLVYEGWAEMAGIAGNFPPRTAGERKYHGFNRGEYHDWYVTLISQFKAERPDAQVSLIPVASSLSTLFSEAPLNKLAATDLYIDDAPHGTPTLYFLAALASYPALFGRPAPSDISLPDSLHPLVKDNLPAITARLADLLGSPQEARAVQTPTPTEEPQIKLQPVLEPSQASFDTPQGQVANPSLAFGLDGISDWSTQHPFINIMKTARPWIGHSAAQWGAFPTEDLAAAGVFDDHGYPKFIPDGALKLEAFVMTDQPEAATDMAGRYRIRWKGEGKLSVAGRGQTERMSGSDNETWLDYTPGEGLVAIAITETDPQGSGNYIRDIEIVREDHIPLHDAGVLFNPGWIKVIANARSLRFMDWMLTNGSPVSTWEGRPKVEHFSYAWRGVPAEVMIALANQVGADPWFCMPHAADDAYSRHFAALVKRDLDPRLMTYVEYSNEVWNHIFPQTKWNVAEATKRWGKKAEGDGWMQFAGLRAAEVMNIWSEVYGSEAESRLVRVMGVHTGWLGLEEPFMTAPLFVAEGGKPPQDSFDAYAVSGYFGFDLGLEEENLPKVRQIVAKSVANAEAAARKRGLKRKLLEEAIAPVKFDEAYPKVAELLWEGSFSELTDTFWPYHARLAERSGLDLIMYEGGTHVTPHGEALNDEDLVSFFVSFNYHGEVGKLYEELLRRWRAQGGQLFNAFVDVAPATKYGSWGALRHLQDVNPRYDSLMAANALAPDTEPRAPGTFLQGITRFGGQGPDELIGTPEEDALVGGPGDDVMRSMGGADHFHGGGGFDIVELPGKASEYEVRSRDGLVLATRGSVTSQLRDVETLYFSQEPTRKYRLTAKR